MNIITHVLKKVFSVLWISTLMLFAFGFILINSVIFVSVGFPWKILKLLGLFKNWKSNPVAWLAKPINYMFAEVLHPAIGNQVHFSSNFNIHEANGGPVLVVGNHPSTLDMFLPFYWLVHHFPGPFRVVIKKELRLWPIGLALEAADSGVVIDRRERDTSTAHIGYNAGLQQGTFLVLADGTRSRPAKVAAAREWLRGQGEADPDAWVVVPPKHRGFLAALSAMPPNVRVVLLMVATDRPCHELWQVFDRPGTTTYIRAEAVEIDATLALDEQACRALLYDLWRERVNEFCRDPRGYLDRVASNAQIAG